MIWFILIIAFLIIEALSFNLITIWFSFGSLCAFISTYFTDNLIIQIAVFTFFTIISLFKQSLYFKISSKVKSSDFNNLMNSHSAMLDSL